MSRTWAVVGLLILVAVGWSIGVAGAGSPKVGGTLVFGAATEQDSLDPAGTFDTAAMRINGWVAENLTNLGPDGNPVPGLAESWEMSADGMTWTFHLRQGVVFHDGTPFNADAVVFNFDRQMNPQNPYYQYGSWGWWDWMYAPVIKSVYKIDAMTVGMTLNFPFSPLLAHLAISGAGTILSPAAIQQYKADVATHPVGTGAFALKEWVRGDHITLVAFDRYWGGRPYLDQIIVRFIPDNTVRAGALIRGEIDLMTDFSPPQLDTLRTAGAQIMIAASLNLSYLAINSEKAPFDNILVRIAVQHAIDKDGLVQALYGELGEVAKGPIPSPEWAYDPNLRQYEYDPELARQYLAAAGYPNGFTTELSIYSAARGYNPVGTELAEAIQAYLAEVGITATISISDYTAHNAKVHSGQHELAFYGWYGDDLDPDEFIYTFCHSSNATVPGANNLAFIKSEEIDSLIDQARTVTDIEARRALYVRAQELVNSTAGWVWLNGIKQPYALTARVQGFTPNPVPWCLDLSHVWLQ